MQPSTQVLSPSEAARRLGVSAKALRFYEGRGLLRPVRTEAGWRAYPQQEMDRAAQVVALRRLGFSLAQVTRVLNGNHDGLDAALAEHQGALESRIRAAAGAVDQVRSLRSQLADGRPPSLTELAQVVGPAVEPIVAFDLPWPWGGERFELRALPAIGFIVGPLGSGKTRLARRLAEELPGAAFLDLNRLTEGVDAARARIAADLPLTARVDSALKWLVEEGATATDALLTLLVGVEDGTGPLIVDMVEQGLDEATQVAAAAWSRRRGAHGTLQPTRWAICSCDTAAERRLASRSAPRHRCKAFLLMDFVSRPKGQRILSQHTMRHAQHAHGYGQPVGQSVY